MHPQEEGVTSVEACVSHRRRIRWHRVEVQEINSVSAANPPPPRDVTKNTYIVEMMWKVAVGGEDWNKCINSTHHQAGLQRLSISIQFEYRLYSIAADTAVVSYCRPPHNFPFFLVLLWQVISKKRASFSCPFSFRNNDTRNRTSLEFTTQVPKCNRYFSQQKDEV